MNGIDAFMLALQTPRTFRNASANDTKLPATGDGLFEVTVVSPGK